MDMYRFYDRLKVWGEEAESPEAVRERLLAMTEPLLSWYEGHARILPWREDPKPYRVWISEIMLQQTRVEAVKPYYERFMEALPTIGDLACVPEERLLKLWQGLGYYNRARNLKKAAAVLVEEYGGELPADYEALLSLPGIGSYTAGAIASIAYGLPLPAVDGNVLRVLSRVLLSREDISRQPVKKKMEEALRGVIPEGDASRYNQGLIEVGALVCVPGGVPKCEDCPFASLCLAREEGCIGEIPVKASKKARRIEEKTVLLLEREDQIAIRKRADTGLLASLYEFPNFEGNLTVAEVAARLGVAKERIAPLPGAKHVFSHVEWHMAGYRVLLDQNLPEGALWVTKQELFNKYPLPNAFSAYMKLIN